MNRNPGKDSGFVSRCIPYTQKMCKGRRVGVSPAGLAAIALATAASGGCSPVALPPPDVARQRLVGHGVPAVTARATGACESLGTAVVRSNVFEGSMEALAKPGPHSKKARFPEIFKFPNKRPISSLVSSFPSLYTKNVKRANLTPMRCVRTARRLYQYHL